MERSARRRAPKFQSSCPFNQAHGGYRRRAGSEQRSFYSRARLCGSGRKTESSRASAARSERLRRRRREQAVSRNDIGANSGKFWLFRFSNCRPAPSPRSSRRSSCRRLEIQSPLGPAAQRSALPKANRRASSTLSLMSPDHSADVKFEIGHVLFIDIVGYSKLLIDEQSEQIQKLKEIVRGTEQVRIAEAEGKLLRLPTGDGGALVFRNNPEATVL